MCKDAKSFRVVNSSFIITQPALAGGRLAGRVPAWITHRRAFLHFFLFQHLSYRVTRNYPGQKDSNVANGRQVWTALWLLDQFLWGLLIEIPGAAEGTNLTILQRAKVTF